MKFDKEEKSGVKKQDGRKKLIIGVGVGVVVLLLILLPIIMVGLK